MPQLLSFLHYNKKSGAVGKPSAPLTVCTRRQLVFLYGSTYRAGISASAALNALVSVDYILAVTLRNAAGGASVSASTASNAIIIDLESHGFYLHL